MPVTDEYLEDRFTLFFDFLGASHAATNWLPERVRQFVDLLISVSAMQLAEAFSGSLQNDGSYRLRVVPEVTTFSDNAVVSYRGASRQENAPPVTSLWTTIESLWTEIVCKDAIRILSQVADRGLTIGLLIRGGLSFEQLHHESGVVFGEALVDAHAIESTMAVHPRVVVSERVISKLSHTRPEDVSALMQDVDRKWHLNYFAEMVRHAVYLEMMHSSRRYVGSRITSN